MSKDTPIEWADSSVNPVMGCDGCELWNPKTGIKTCYAGQIHEMRAGQPGYADDFLVPKLFAGRMAEAARWRDLTGTDRPDKPWLNDMPRMVFVSDMGDALSKDVPFRFLWEEVIQNVARWRHIGLWLTKQPGRMAEFSRWLADKGVGWPPNLWAMTSITGPQTLARVKQLRSVVGPVVRGLSIEPILQDPGDIDLSGIQWAIMGGESGKGARMCEVENVRRMVVRVRAAGAAPFVKQLGSVPVLNEEVTGNFRTFQGRRQLEMKVVKLPISDRKGGQMSDWPDDLRGVREVPR